MRVIFLFTILFSILISCQKPEQNDNRQGMLTSFQVTVLERKPVTAIISWTPSEDIINGDTVRYKVFLNNNLIKSDLLQTKDTLIGLSGDLAYDGLVLAYTASGDTASSPFRLEKVQEYMAFHNENRYEVYDMASGVRLWSKSWGVYSNDFGSSTILGDTVFFSNNQLGGSVNSMFANNLKTGQQIWSAISITGANTGLEAQTNIVFDNDKLYVSARNGLKCLNRNTGQELWTFSDSYILSTPVISGNRVFISTTSQPGTFAIDKNSGTLLWKFLNNWSTGVKPIALQNLLIVSANSSLYGLNPATGNVLWQKNFGGLFSPETIIRINDNLIVAFVPQDGLYGINPANGNVIWYSIMDWLSHPSITAGNDKVFISDYSRGKMVGVNALNGVLLWEPALTSNDEYFLIYAKQKLYAFTGNKVVKRNALTGVLENITTMLGASYPIRQPTIKINDTTFYQCDHGNFK